jgi:lipoate---protein ligase
MQMATDSVLLLGLAEGLSPPSLRFYGWSKPTLSIGYHQKQVWPDLEVVRRPSGGRAVWHEGDLTYALTLPLPQGSVAKVYAQLCAFLIEGFKKLGIYLEFGTTGRGYIHNPRCRSRLARSQADRQCPGAAWKGTFAARIHLDPP